MAEPTPIMGHVFVYGTLKRGQCREHCWPVRPLDVRPAWIRGRLIDLGAYPALLDGDQRVWGEVWSFDQRDLPEVHAALDRVEVTNQPGVPNEYDRVAVTVFLAEGDASLEASTYRFADQALAARIQPLPASLAVGTQRYVVWPRR